MDIVKINRNTPTDGLYKLNVTSMVEMNNELVFEFEGDECYSINEGDYLTFMRRIKGEDNNNVVYQDMVLVKSEDEDHRIHTTLLPTFRIELLANDWYNFYYDEENSYYIIDCNEKHFLFAQDLAVNATQELYFKDSNNNLLCTVSGISAMNRYSQQPLVIDDCFIFEEKIKTCGKSYDYVKNYYYNFLPLAESNYSVIINDFSPYLAKDAVYFETKFNPYYFYTIEVNDKGVPIELDSNGNGIRHCTFYDDVWFSSLRSTKTKKYINSGSSVSHIYENKAFFNISLGIAGDIEENKLGGDDMFSASYAQNIENSLIPEFIDVERVKYAPYRKEKNSYYPVTKITIYPHFRERVLLDKRNNTNTISSSGNLYSDGWYIDPYYNASKYWNGYNWANGFNDFEDFIYNNGKKADLIGYLNFTDNDIFYKKDKVGKSFYRFSFYNSTDPIEQKLLFYSTVFVDSTELLSKYMKQSYYIEENRGITDTMDENYIVINGITSGNANVETVFCENEQVKSRLDTKITITNEYDRTRSAEGFNIYLFYEDVPIGISGETIYMKVEFNHAGNGKTMPMIMWPKDDGGHYMHLNIDNFIENLYIPIDIIESDGRFIYTIRNAEYDDDGNIELILLEPKLDVE